MFDNIEDGLLKLGDGRSVPVIIGACDGHREVPSDHDMPVHDGLIGETVVKVLRDTGCSSAAVRGELVKPEQMLDKDHMYVLIDGTVRRF